TAENAAVSAAAPAQSLLVATVTAGLALVLLNVIVGSGRKAVTPSGSSDGPAARASSGLVPTVPVPPSTVPIVIDSPAASGVRIERLLSRPGSFVPGSTERFTVALVTLATELPTTTL